MLTIFLSLKGRITKGEILQMVRNWEILERKQVHQLFQLLLGFCLFGDFDHSFNISWVEVEGKGRQRISTESFHI